MFIAPSQPCFVRKTGRGIARYLTTASLAGALALAAGHTTAAPAAPAAAGEQRITYQLAKAAEPTPEEEKAYAQIQAAMDKAVGFYNKYTTVPRKHLLVKYSPGTPTADGSSNGTIRVGKNAKKAHTLMHEIAHTLGVGTSGQWRKLMVDHVFTGENATATLREITGNPNAVLHGDRMHFWPYGLNYDKEVKSDEDLIRHCKMVDAICKDLRKAAGK